MKINPTNFICFLSLVITAVLGTTAFNVSAADWMIQMPDPAHVFYDKSDHALAIGSDGTMYLAYGGKNLYLAKKMPGSAEWVVEIVDSSSQVGSYASLALDTNDNPHISYQDYGNLRLKYARYDGSLWHIEVTGSQAGYPATGTSIALDSANCPHIAYFDSHYDRIHYAHFNGTAWQHTMITTLSNAWDSYLHLSIALDSSDHPHIVCCHYWYNVLCNLKHYFFNGSAWDNQTILSGAGESPSMVIDNNDHIHIAYRGTGGSYSAGLGYGYYDGSSWQTTNISAGEEVAAWMAITVSEDNTPHIAYLTNGGFKHAEYNGGWQFEPVSSDLGAATAIAVDSANYIHISFINRSKELKYLSNQGGTWTTQTPDYSSGSGRYTSIAVDSADRPHIIHFADLINKIKYTYHNGSDFVSEIVDSINSGTVQSPSLALDSVDLPHIVYYNYENSTHLLKYAHHDGLDWNLENVGDGSYYMSVALDSNDRPHICYIHSGALKYSLFNGTTWVTEIIASSIYIPHCPSIALDSNDKPHIIYFDKENVEFRYVNYNGGTWNFETLSVSGSTSTTFKTTSIAVDSNDLPHVCWTDGTLNYANYDGTQWNIQGSIETVANNMDMALDSANYPHISYFNPQGSDLKYGVYDGTSWELETVDAIGAVGEYSSIALDSQNIPHISYYDATSKELKYATISAGSCDCDLNADNVCDMQDLQIFTSEWGQDNCTDCDCDLDGDGDCDGADLSLFGNDWSRPDCR